MDDFGDELDDLLALEEEGEENEEIILPCDDEFEESAPKRRAASGGAGPPRALTQLANPEEEAFIRAAAAALAGAGGETGLGAEGTGEGGPLLPLKRPAAPGAAAPPQRPPPAGGDAAPSPPPTPPESPRAEAWRTPRLLASAVTEGISVTGPDGERVYCAVRGDGAPGEAAAGPARRRGAWRFDRAEPVSAFSATLERAEVAVAIHARRVEERARMEAARAEATRAEATRAEGSGERGEGAQRQPEGGGGGGGGDGDGRSGRSGSQGTARPRDAPRSSLWAQAHAPDGFLQLLSDERTNREVAAWLKAWDPCVFGGARGGAGGSGAGQGAANPYVDPEDPLGRPRRRVALLVGPPGLGKTTLARVVARHCGYRALELNGSDVRSASALRTALGDATQASQVLGERRPTCVVLDEIDGAVAGEGGRMGVSAILELANAPVAPARAGGGGAAARGRGAGEGPRAGAESGTLGRPRPRALGAGLGAAAPPPPGGRGPRGGAGEMVVSREPGQGPRARPLRRPIICVANDLYAPALRALRAAAEVFVLRPPEPGRLAARLALVCRLERVRVEEAALRALAERARGDVRACLGALQFAAAEARRGGGGGGAAVDPPRRPGRRVRLSPAALARAPVAADEARRDARDSWLALLREPEDGALAGVAPGPAQRRSSAALRARRASAAWIEAGLEALGDGPDAPTLEWALHERLPRLGARDGGVERTAAAAELLSLSDAGRRGPGRAVAAAQLLRAARLLSQRRPEPLVWPTQDARARRACDGRRAAALAWRLACPGPTAAALPARALVADVAPLLPALLAPPLRSIEPRLHSPDERMALSRLVAVMLSLGLRFGEERVRRGAPGEDDEDGWPEPEADARGPGTARDPDAFDAFGPDRLFLLGGEGPAGRAGRADEAADAAPPPGPAGAAEGAPARARGRLGPLSPPVHALSSYLCPPASTRPLHPLSEVARQVAQRELELSAIRAAAASRAALAPRAVPGLAPAAAAGDAEPPASRGGPPGDAGPAPTPGVVPKTLAERLKGSAAARAGPARKRGAGTWIEQLRSRKERASAARATEEWAAASDKAGADAPPGAGGAAKGGTRFIYHEGYTNAVRRALRVPPPAGGLQVRGRGCGPRGAPRGFFLPSGYPPPSGGDDKGYATGYPPAGYPGAGGYPPQGQYGGGYAQQYGGGGYPQQGYNGPPPQQYNNPPPQHVYVNNQQPASSSPGADACCAGCLAALCCCCLAEALF